MKRIEFPPFSEFAENSYLLVSDSGNGVLIDAPYGAYSILNRIKDEGITLKMLLLTHGHCDHIASAANIQAQTHCSVYIHEGDLKKLSDNVQNLTRYFNLPPIDPVENSISLKDGDTVELDEMKFRVLHTPGHSSGSVCYIIGNDMYCGDTLFKGSVGRVDMTDGNPRVMQRTLDMLKGFETDIDYNLFCGHGPSTTISRERRLNPYLQ